MKTGLHWCAALLMRGQVDDVNANSCDGDSSDGGGGCNDVATACQRSTKGRAMRDATDKRVDQARKGSHGGGCKNSSSS